MTSPTAQDEIEEHFARGQALAGQGRLEEGLGQMLAALAAAQRPAHAMAVSDILMALGQKPQALDVLRRAVAANPDDSRLHSQLLVRMLLVPTLSVSQMNAERQAWRERHGQRIDDGWRPSLRNDGRLRVAYLGGHLDSGAEIGLGLQMRPLLTNHDPLRVSVTVYGDRDFTPQRLGDLWDRADWISLKGLDDTAAARLIREGQHHVLVGLIGHGPLDRTPLFNRRMAPVQANLHGMMTSGAGHMDVWLGDGIATPKDSQEAFSESLHHLPHLFCFATPRGSPPITPLPALQSKAPAYGCFNQAAKLSPACIQAMAAVLRATPGSTLTLKSRDGAYSKGASALLTAEAFAAHGIGPERLRFLPPTPSQAENLALYGQIDIALDSFPYSGCLTTFDALWMGVPTVTLGGGETFITRMSQAVLTSAGLGNLVADDISGYVEKATALAADPKALSELRQGLRDRVAASALCDGGAYARSLEDAFGTLFQHWCRERP